MSREITGAVEWRGGRWQVHVTKPDRSRPWIDLPGSIPADDEDKARRVARIVARRISNASDVPLERGETVKEYGERWVEWRDKRGITCAVENESNLRIHFHEKHAHLPMAGVTREMLEDFITTLDKAVVAGTMRWKTARNVWGTVAKMFDEAANAKDRAMRVIATNPAAGIKPPDKGDITTKQFLYPNELLKLVSCGDVPLLRRRLYAFAVYTFTRASEIVPVDWDTDVDLEHDVILFHEGVDRCRTPDKVKSTKNGQARRIPIEPALRPLLGAMHDEVNGKGRVFPVLPCASGDSGLANLLRDDLLAARVERHELHNEGISTKRMTFHDLRATGVTWMAVRGDDPLKIMSRAGHRAFQTTQGYIREAESLRQGFGVPFPPLPEALMAPLSRPGSNRPGKDQKTKNRSIFPRNSWAQQDLNLRLHPCEGCTLPLSYAPSADSFRSSSPAPRASAVYAIAARIRFQSSSRPSPVTALKPRGLMPLAFLKTSSAGFRLFNGSLSSFVATTIRAAAGSEGRAVPRTSRMKSRRATSSSSTPRRTSTRTANARRVTRSRR
jgi:integrase